MLRKVANTLINQPLAILVVMLLFLLFPKKTVFAQGTYRCEERPVGCTVVSNSCDAGCNPAGCPSTCLSGVTKLCDCSSGSDIFGRVVPPPGVSRYSGGNLPGLRDFINNMIKTIIVIAGIYALFNLALAGYSFMSAGGDPKKVADAWAKIWQTLIGLAVAVGSFTLAAIFGKLIFGEWDALIQLRVFGP